MRFLFEFLAPKIRLEAAKIEKLNKHDEHSTDLIEAFESPEEENDKLKINKFQKPV